jgi:ubiquinone/menaquinone biosynthesis C-methylase UbiE
MSIFSKLETLAYLNIVVPLQGKATFDFVKNHYSKGMKTLDFGCGTGSNSKLFHAEDYIGAEVDMSRVQSSTKKYAKKTFEKIPIINSADNKLPWENDSFDLIFISLCLHHINAKNCKLIFKEFNRVLKSSGKILGLEPCVIEKNYFSNICMNVLDAGDYILPIENYKNIYASESFKTNHINIVKTFGYNLWQYSSKPISDKSTPYQGGMTTYRRFMKPVHVLGLYGKWFVLVFLVFLFLKNLINVIIST